MCLLHNATNVRPDYAGSNSPGPSSSLRADVIFGRDTKISATDEVFRNHSRRQLFNTGEPRTSRREACDPFATGNPNDYPWSSRTPIVTESVPPAHRGR